MNNCKINDSIIYQGNVTIKYGDRTIRKHNEGKLDLFTFLTRSLAHVAADNYSPYAIQLYTPKYDSEGSIIGYDEALITSVAFVSQPLLYYDDTISKIKSNAIEYTFNIPQILLKHQDKEVTRIALLNKNYDVTKKYIPLQDFVDGEGICATIDLSDEDVINLNTSLNIIIYWKISFNNNQINS